MVLLQLFAVAALAQSPNDLGTRTRGSDWPGFLGPLGTGVSSERGIIKPWPKEGLRILWQMPLGTGYGMPSIARGRLFHFDRHGNQARLSCMTSEGGKLLWKFEYTTAYEDYYGYNNGPRCCPVIDSNRVYIHGAEGMLHCLSVTDGTLIWKVDTFTEFGVVQNFFGVGSTPIIEKDLLIAHIGGSPPGSGTFPTPDQKGNGTAIVAFNKFTGKVVYRASDELASYAGPVVASVAGRRHGFIFARGGLVGFNPENGRLDFRFPWRAKSIESVNGANPIVVDDRVFISETYGPGSALLRVDGSGYKVIWSDADRPRNKRMQCHWSTPIHHNGFVYACSGRHVDNAELRCVELETGAVKWSQPDLTRVSLLEIDGHFICLGEDGVVRLVRINSEKYEEVSTLKLPPGANGRQLLTPPCWAAPIVSHGLLYLRGNDRLICLELIPE